MSDSADRLCQLVYALARNKSLWTHRLCVTCWEALPFKATAQHCCAGREVLRLYARLRGVPPAIREQAIEQLLTRIGLQQYSDRCGQPVWQAS